MNCPVCKEEWECLPCNAGMFFGKNQRIDVCIPCYFDLYLTKMRLGVE